MKKLSFLLLCCAFLATMNNNQIFKTAADDNAPRRAEILFLGHSATTPHDPGRLAAMLSPLLFKDGISITYTADTSDLNASTLSKYDALVIYANYETIKPSQEKALKDFVENGKGLVALHAATNSFTNSDWYLKTVGAQFVKHGEEVFKAKNTNSSHPVMQGVSEFSSWDESRVQKNTNPDKTVLQERVNADGSREAWTWVRNQGKGRVFYTAGGHNDSTWIQPAWEKLVENGIKWAIGDKVAAQVASFRSPIVRYNDTIIVPNYEQVNPAPKYQYALTPQESMQTMQVPTDFELQLFASEPDITNPIAMSWDEKGRLWIVESVDYPNTFLETDGAANDRIKICEDTNGDGKADKFTIFADKLNIPTSIVFANGGIVVSMAPHFVFLKDTNGDDKADVRENIVSGWAKDDTHFGPSNLTYGFDNKIWGVIGTNFNGTTKEGNKLSFRRGVYNLNPDGTGLEFLAIASNNTWGFGITEDNNTFVSTANGDHSDFYSMSLKYAQRQLPNKIAAAKVDPLASTSFSARQQGRVASTNVLPLQNIQGHTDIHTLNLHLRQVDFMGGFTAAAGHHFYTARSFPKEYWNRIAFVNEPTGRLIHRAVIEPKGAGFSEKDGWNLLASNDEWAGPVQAEVGPDGAVWVADWYNFIIQHNPTPGPTVSQGKQFATGNGRAFVTPMRDLERGRIYRIVYKNAKPYSPVKISRTNTASLISALENDNMFWRMTAQRILVENKNVEALPGLYKIINNQNVDEIGLNSPAVHALWTLKGLGALDGANTEAIEVATKALSHPAAGVRKAAVAVLPKTQQTFDALQKAGLINDKDLNVRMNTLIAIADLPASSVAAKAIYAASLNPENAKDEWISKALLAAALKNEVGFFAEMTKTADALAGQELTLTQRIFKGLTEESYDYTVGGTAGAAGFANPSTIEVKGKEITIRAVVSPKIGGVQRTAGQSATPPAKAEGFILGQGDKTNGYGVYILNGNINMVVYQDGKSYKAVSSIPLPDRYTLVARLNSSGAISISVDGKEVATAKAPAMFTKEPSVTLRTAADNASSNDRLGDYNSDLNFTGTSQVNLSLKTIL